MQNKDLIQKAMQVAQRLLPRIQCLCYVAESLEEEVECRVQERYEHFSEGSC